MKKAGLFDQITGMCTITVSQLAEGLLVSVASWGSISSQGAKRTQIIWPHCILNVGHIISDSFRIYKIPFALAVVR